MMLNEPAKRSDVIRDSKCSIKLSNIFAWLTMFDWQRPTGAFVTFTSVRKNLLTPRLPRAKPSVYRIPLYTFHEIWWNPKDNKPPTLVPPYIHSLSSKLQDFSSVYNGIQCPKVFNQSRSALYLCLFYVTEVRKCFLWCMYHYQVYWGVHVGGSTLSLLRCHLSTQSRIGLERDC